MFIGCGHVVRLAALKQVGAYDPTPGGYGGEEKDLCLRLLDAGFRVMTLRGVHVWHDKTPVAREIPKQHRSGVCNDLVMTLRRTPLSALPLALPVKFFRHFQFAWNRNLVGPCLAGFGLFLRNSPFLWRTRRPVRLETLKTFIRLTRT
jgi:GT2 family glycosyltransferase